MTEIRCKKCNRLLMKTISIQLCSEIEVKCPKCGFVDIFILSVEHKGQRGMAFVAAELVRDAKFDLLGEVEKDIYRQMA